LEECAVGFVDHPLRFGSNGAEYERAFTRTRDSSEDGEPTLRDLKADVVEVVFASTLHPDYIVGISRVLAGGVRA
jgi:hypothetical protein